MDTQPILRSQYLAALEMLKQTILKCPDTIWDDPTDKTKFWHIAYHALFYTHLYLQDSEQEFRAWSRHREDYQFMGRIPWPPHNLPAIGEPYTQADVLAYLEICQQQVDEKTMQLKPDAPSGFYWLPFSKLELQIYSIRHLQQHTGELMERLGTRANLELDWVGTI